MPRSNRVLALTLVAGLASSSAIGAEKADVAAKATAAAKAAKAVTQSPEAAAMKAKASAALSNMSAEAAKARQGMPQQGQAFTPEQMSKIQSQAVQAFTNLTSDPQAAAAAAKGGVTTQKLNALQTQTSAVVAGMKGPDGKLSPEAAAQQMQQLQQLMKSDQATALKGQASQAVSNLKADPKFNQSAAQFKEGAQALTQSPGFQKGVQGLKESAGKAGQALKDDKTYRDRGTDPTPGYLKSGATSAKVAADKALTQFCKKFEGQTEVEAPAKCKKPKLVPVKQ
ncbi:MAG: hypothetical protein HY928_17620 [Elusimicrobia bacterium]|nr:hypothetical protein [Elusimicrobiota bacterium]